MSDGGEGEAMIGQSALRRQQHEPRVRRQRRAERRPRFVARDMGKREVIEPGAAQPAVGEDEAAGLDDVDSDAKTGAEADQSAGILRDIGLEEGKAHGDGEWHRGR